MSYCQHVSFEKKCMNLLMRDDSASIMQCMFYKQYKCSLVGHTNYICKKCAGVVADDLNYPEIHALQCYNRYYIMKPGIQTIKLDHCHLRKIKDQRNSPVNKNDVYLFIDAKTLIVLFPQILYLQCHDEFGNDVLKNINADNIDFTDCCVRTAVLNIYGVASDDIKRTVGSIVRDIIRCFEKIGSKCLFCGMLYDSVPCMQLTTQHLRRCCVAQG